MYNLQNVYKYVKNVIVVVGEQRYTAETLTEVSTLGDEHTTVTVSHDHTDENEDGICDIGGELLGDTKAVKLEGYSITLDGSIGVNFYMLLSDEIVKDSQAKLVFTMPNGSVQEMSVGQAIQKKVTGKKCYQFTTYVSAKEMTANIHAELITKNGKMKEYDYCVKDYADYVLQHADNFEERMLRLVETMLSYGAETQRFFGYHTDKLADASIGEMKRMEVSDEVISSMSQYAKQIISSDDEIGVQYVGSSLLLKSTITIRHYFKLEEGRKIEDYDFMIYSDSVKVKPVKAIRNGEIYYYIDIANISPRLADTHSLAVIRLKNQESYIGIAYCTTSYLYDVYSNKENYSEDLLEVLKAYMSYCMAAMQYFMR